MNFGPRTPRKTPRPSWMSPTSGDQLLRYRQPPGSEPGETETIIGNWFASGGGQREQTVIATKVYGEMGGWPNEASCPR
jgi:NDP-hexose C3-ketoreductase / dTDP-4-oxo-2-deoxy-alpha-D-pentos-2-ene 2,3-reductase